MNLEEEPKGLDASQQPVPEKAAPKLANLLKRLWSLSGQIGCVSTIGLGVPALYFALVCSPVKQISYTIEPSRRIYDGRVSVPAIRVMDRNGVQVRQDVYVTEVAVWNSGNQVIEPETVRRPLRILLPKGHRLLDCTLARERGEGVAGFSLVIQRSESGGDGAVLTWRHLDPGFAARLLLVHAGSQEGRPVLGIYAVGTDLQRRTGSPGPLTRTNFVMGLALGFALGVVFVIASVSIGFRVPAEHLWMANVASAIVICVFAAAVGWVVLAFYVSLASGVPPI